MYSSTVNCIVCIVYNSTVKCKMYSSTVAGHRKGWPEIIGLGWMWQLNKCSPLALYSDYAYYHLVAT